MSGKATGWALEQSLPPTTKLVLVALADECRRDGTSCFPARKRLAECVGVKARALSNHLAELEERGLIRREERFRDNGSRTSSLYHLAINGPLARQDKGGIAPDDKVPVHEPRQGTPCTGVQGHVVEPTQKEPGSEPELHKAEFADWLSDFHQVTARTQVTGSQPAVRQFRARREEGKTLEDLKLATRGCHSDEFCRDHGFDVPETILRARNITRYIELGRNPKPSRNGAGEHPATRRIREIDERLETKA